MLSTYNAVEKVQNVDVYVNSSATIFAMIFWEIFMTGDLEYVMPDGRYGASRSSLTYTIAYSILTTARMIGFDCIFEAEGKRDAVIQTKDASVKILYCEWEWDYGDIFGKGKEIDKLIKSTKKEKSASGLPFTYVPENEYTQFLLRVSEQWQRSKNKFEDQPLILILALFKPIKGLT